MTLETERSGGSGQGLVQFEFSTDEPIHEIFVAMKFLEVTDLPTIAEVLTQFATTITAKQGSRSVLSMSAADLWHTLNLARAGGLAAHQTDGTGADNAVNSIVMPIPLAPLGIFNDINPEYGLDPKVSSVVLDLVVPADSALDNRKYTVMYASVEGKRPTRVIDRITRNYTAPATGDGQYIKLPSGADVSLYDLAMFQTTGLTAGTTTDAVGVTSVSLEINQEEQGLVDVYSLGIQSNLRNLSQAASSPAESSTYMYWNPNRPHLSDMSIPLPKDARISYNAGVAEAVRFFGGIDRKI